MDTYFGTQVADPYRWLEDTDSPETKQWVEAENALTFQYLGDDSRARGDQGAAHADLELPEVSPCRCKRGKDYFYTENSGLQNQAVLYVQHGLKGEKKLVLDPNTLSADGTVRARCLGRDGEREVPRVRAWRPRGSDWEEIRVRDIEKAKDLPDTLKWVKFSGIAWTKDNKGFFYSRYEEPKSGNAMLAKNEAEALLPSRGQAAGEGPADSRAPRSSASGTSTRTVSDDGEYVVIYVVGRERIRTTAFYFIDLGNPGSRSSTIRS